MKPKSLTYVLHSLQGQLLGVHFLIFELKISKLSDSFISWGIKFQTLGPKLHKDSVPLCTILIPDDLKSVCEIG